MKIRVTTEQLRTAADEAAARVDKVTGHFENIGSIVNGTAGYWEGEGQEAFRRSYADRIERIWDALVRFNENITDLRQMAGIYETAEADITEAVQPLPSDVIV